MIGKYRIYDVISIFNCDVIYDLMRKRMFLFLVLNIEMSEKWFLIGLIGIGAICDFGRKIYLIFNEMEMICKISHHKLFWGPQSFEKK